MNCLLSLIEHWFSICATCVRLGGYLSCFFSSQVRSKTRRGAVSPFLCCVHRRLNKETSSFELWLLRPIGVCKRFLYADDIIVLAPSTDALMRLLRLVEDELVFLDMALNASKSDCIRYGPRFDSDCSEISTNDA